jgi:lysophospholipase L1-like esterase
VWVEAVRHRKPDLVTFAYGTNEAMSGLGTVARYERDVRAVLKRLHKAAPQVSCVLISPFDVLKRKKGRRNTPVELSETIDAQRRVGGELGCGFWDGRAFMGGEGSMRDWIKAKPPLASGDGIHLTRLGYVYAGVGLGDALMRAYDLQRGAMASLAPSHHARP